MCILDTSFITTQTKMSNRAGNNGIGNLSCSSSQQGVQLNLQNNANE